MSSILYTMRCTDEKGHKLPEPQGSETYIVTFVTSTQKM